MKKHLFVLVALVMAVSSGAAWACGDDDAHAANASSMGKPELTLVSTAATAQGAVFHVKGMMCSSCRKKIEASLRKVDGVQAVSFDMKHKVAKVTFASGKTVASAALIKAVQDAGFEATPAAKVN